MTATLNITQDNVRKIEKTIGDLASMRVVVGITSETDGKHAARGGVIGNAVLGYTQETGSPANNLPARPFLMPGVEESRPAWEPHLRAAATAAFEGNAALVDRELHTAGTIARDAAKAKIAAGIPPPLKPATVAARYRKYRKSAGLKMRQREAAKQAAFVERFEAGIETGAGPTTPLWSTGSLINSITYAIRRG